MNQQREDQNMKMKSLDKDRWIKGHKHDMDNNWFSFNKKNSKEARSIEMRCSCSTSPMTFLFYKSWHFSCFNKIFMKHCYSTHTRGWFVAFHSTVLRWLNPNSALTQHPLYVLVDILNKITYKDSFSAYGISVTW